jgi:hypothetical protein
VEIFRTYLSTFSRTLLINKSKYIEEYIFAEKDISIVYMSRSARVYRWRLDY